MMTSQYLAGLFDGEGCVRLCFRRKWGQISLSVILSNTYRPVLETVKEKYGGSISSSGGKTLATVPCYNLCLRDRLAESLLSDIAPHSIIKADQINLALEFRRFVTRSKEQRCVLVRRPLPLFPNRRIWEKTEETMAAELEYKDRISRLKRSVA